ncbi:MAG: sulfite exporter TauE/SafE family protein [Thermoplasmatota archaeon]
MDQRILFLGAIFLYGLFIGGTYCNFTCGPLLILRLAGQGRGAKDGLVLSLLFSLPRILILTIMGVVIGTLGYGSALLTGSGRLWFFTPVLYLFISGIMIFSGVRFLRDKVEKQCGDGKPTLKSRLLDLAVKIGPRKGKSERISLMGIGILISLLCFSQGALASVTVSGALGLGSSALSEGAIWGGLGMMAFSIGMSAPLVVLGTGASWIGEKLQNKDVRNVGGILLIGFGALIIILQIISIISNI